MKFSKVKGRFTAFVLLFMMMFGLSRQVYGDVIEFVDVPENAWYWNTVQKSYKYNLFVGTGDKHFSPETYIIRGDFVTVIGRMYENGEDVVIAEVDSTPFSDVSSEKYYGKYISWAAQNGIVNGYGYKQFGPDDYITREQMCVIISNYIEYVDAEIEYDPDVVYLEFNDFIEISSFALEAVTQLCQYSIIYGSDDGCFYPQNSSMRVECAATLVRLCDQIYDWSTTQ